MLQQLNTRLFFIITWHMMYQHIIISQSHKSVTDTDIENIDITEDERAAIVYIIGYLVRALIKKVTKQHQLHKNNHLYLLFLYYSKILSHPMIPTQ